MAVKSELRPYIVEGSGSYFEVTFPLEHGNGYANALSRARYGVIYVDGGYYEICGDEYPTDTTENLILKQLDGKAARRRVRNGLNSDRGMMPKEDEVSLVLDSVERLDEGLEAAPASAFDNALEQGWSRGYWFIVAWRDHESVYTKAMDLGRRFGVVFVEGDYYRIVGRSLQVRDGGQPGEDIYLVKKLESEAEAARWVSFNYALSSLPLNKKPSAAELVIMMQLVQSKIGVYSWGEPVVKQPGEA
jgi:hypothetical protein